MSFVDITAAFYSVLREFLLPNHADISSLVALCNKLGFSADATGDVLQALASQSDPCISEVWQARVFDVLSHTWFQVLGSSSCVATRRGSRPGDPLADLLYGIVMAQALTEIQQHFEAAGLSLTSSQAGILPGVPVEDSVIPATGAWQDDAVFFVAASSCADLLPKCREAIRIVHTAFAVRGLAVNYKPSKTELLLCPVGAGSRAVNRQIYQQPPFRLAVMPDIGPVVCVRVVPEYVHLGSVVEWSGSLTPVIEQAIDGAVALARPLRRHVFSNRDAPIAVRVLLFRSLVLSKALYGTGAWAGLTKGEALQWQAGVTRLLKFLVPYKDVREDPKISLLWLLRAVRLPAPIVLLRLERLRLLRQVPSKDLVPLRKVVEAAAGSKRCWLTDVLADLKWLQGVAREAEWQFPLGPDLECDLVETFSVLQSYERDFNALIKKAWRWASKNVRPCDILHADSQPTIEQTCPICSQVCKGPRGLSSHVALRHGIFPAASTFIRHTGCPACQTEFHHRRRAIKHLRSSPQCLEWLRLHTQPAAPCTTVAGPRLGRAWLRASWRRPCAAGCIEIVIPGDDDTDRVRSLEELLAPG